MGNSLFPRRIAYETAVRVFHGNNGQLLLFRKPTEAVTLLRQHPNHLLIYSVVQVRQTLSAHRPRVLRRSVHIRLVRPGDDLHGGRDYFLVYIPAQYRPRFAKYFDLSQARRNLSSCSASPRSRFSSNPAASPLYSPTASPLYSPTASPLYGHEGSPRQSFWSAMASPLAPPLPKSRFGDRTGVAPPRSTYRPSPLSLSTPHITRVATPRSIHIPVRYSSRETTRVSTPLSTHILTRSNGISRGTRVATSQPIQIPSPMRGSTQTTRAVNDPAHSKRIQGPGDSPTPRQHITLGSIITGCNNVAGFNNQNPYPAGSVSSPGRVRPPGASTQHTNSDIRHLNYSEAQRDSPDRFERSPGNWGASPNTTKGNFNQRQKGSSPYSAKNSPRRSSKPGRQRRSGMRSQSYPKASVSSKSPGREAISAPFLTSHDSGESRTTTKSRLADPAAELASATVPSSGVNSSTVSRLKRSVSSRFNWAPGLRSISETSIADTAAVDESSVRSHFGLKPLERRSFFRRAR